MGSLILVHLYWVRLFWLAYVAQALLPVTVFVNCLFQLLHLLKKRGPQPLGCAESHFYYRAGTRNNPPWVGLCGTCTLVPVTAFVDCLFSALHLKKTWIAAALGCAESHFYF
jgi:hypothetical protein